MAGSWYAFAFWAFVVLVFVGLWVSFAGGLVRSARALWHPRAVAAFARANGWSNESRGWRPLRPGPPLWSATSAACSDVSPASLEACLSLRTSTPTRITDEVPAFVWHDYGLTPTPSS